MAKKTSVQEFEKNILNYADEITTIESFVDAVRKTVGQYLGYVDTRGHINMIREIIQNSYDEMIKVASPCHDVWVEYDEKTMRTTVRDNGRGIPFDNLIRVFTQQHTSSNYKKKPYEYSSGRHGVGSKVTNACSSEFIAESYRFTGEARRVEFHEGKPWKKGEIAISNKDKYQGSVVSFIPSFQVMKNLQTTCEDVLMLATTILYLTPSIAENEANGLHGVVNTLHFKGIKANGKVIERDVQNIDGIISFLVVKTESPVIPPIYIKADNGTIKTDIVFTYDSTDMGGEPDILSFANMCPTVNEKSEHVTGFTTALTNYFRNYMNKIFLTKGKTKCIGADILAGIRAVVTVSHLEPIFSGQAKEIYSGEGTIEFIRDTLETQLNEWVKMNSNDLQKLCKFYKTTAELRMAEEVNKTNFIKKVKTTAFGLPDGYYPPAGNKNLEFLICEGKSALSSVKGAIDPRKQGVYSIRGKIINAFTNSREKVLQNEEVCGIASILRGGIGKNFDITKCPFEKIIFCGDADPDGKNIRQLLMKLFLMYFKDLIADGRVYLAQPPLYSINKGKGKKIFFTDKTDYIKYLQKSFSSSYKALDQNKKPLSASEITSILYNNSDYMRDLEIIAMNYAADPQLLEYIIRYRGMPFEWCKKFFKKHYRFMEVKKQNGVMILDGLAGDQYYTIVCGQQLFAATSYLNHYIDNSLEYYYLNDELVTLYGLMKTFYKFKPSNIQRYKGLGEMPSADLKVSTIHPDYDRSLLRLTTEDIKRDIAEIRNIQSDLSALLKDVDMSQFEF